MSGEADNIRFEVSKGRKNDSSCQERKRTSHSMSGEEDNIRFHLSRGK
jgi:hypothetical protein